MSIPFPKYAWGDLNPILKPGSAERKDSTDDNWVRAMLRISEKHYESDVFRNTGPYLGYVLRIETHGWDPTDSGFKQAEASVRTQVKVRIPEVHAPIPEPKNSEDHHVIDMHHTFTATDNNVFEPKVGDLVWVDFQNKQTWKGAILLGPIEQPPLGSLIGQPATTTSARIAGEVCVDGCLQPAKSKSSTIDTSTFPIAKGSLVPKKGNDKCLIIGDSQIKLELGKTMQAYMKSTGWKTERIGRSGAKVSAWLAGEKCNKTAFKLWGCAKDYFKKNKPGLIFISLGGNNRGDDTAKAGTDIATLVKRIRQECGWTSGTTSGIIIVAACPPVVPGGRVSGESHQINNPGSFTYRATVNSNMRKELAKMWGFGSKLHFIDPIKNWQKFVPNYMARKTTGDGVHMDPESAKEYVSSIAVKFGATARAAKPAPGAEGKESAKEVKEEGSDATAKEKDEKKKSLIDGMKEAYKKMGQKINSSSRSAVVNDLNRLQKQRKEIQDKIKAAGTDVPQTLKDELAATEKLIEDLQNKLEKWPKPPECRPCRVYSHRPLAGKVAAAVERKENGPAVGLMNTVSGLKGPVLEIENLKHLSFMAAKCADGRNSSKFLEQSKKQKAMCEAAGISFHTWSWVYATDYERAKVEGTVAGKAAKALGSKCHWVNAEKHWCGVEGQPFYEDPAGRLAEFLKAFRAVAPGIPLANCCMTYRAQPALKPVQTQINKMFDIFSPMQYSSGETGGANTQTKKWKTNWELANRAGVAFAPVLGTGRQDPKTRQVWGNFEAMIQTQSTHAADWLCLFNGVPSAAQMLSNGNHVNTSILDMIKELRK